MYRIHINFILFTFLCIPWMFFCTPLKAQIPNTLNGFIETAQKNSPLLNDYNNQMVSAKIDSLKLRATYGFLVSGEANATYAPNLKGWGYDNALSNGKTLFAGVRASKEILSKNNLDTRLQSFSANVQQILAQKNISIQSLKKQVTEQYIATYAAEQRYLLTEEILKVLHQEDVILKKLTQASVFRQTDYLTFKVTLQQNELALQQQKLDWQNSFALLNYLCGIVDDNFTHLSPPDFQELSQPKSFDETVYAQAFDADKLKIENDKAVLLYNYKPKVSVFSDAGYQSSFALTPYKNFGLGLGVGVSIPIYDGHQKKMLLQQNDLALQTRQTYRNQQEKQYQQLLLQLQNQLEQYQKMLTLAEQQLTYSKTLVEANAKQLPTGDVKTVDFILSISNYLGLKANIIQYQENILLLQNQLHYLILP